MPKQCALYPTVLSTRLAYFIALSRGPVIFAVGIAVAFVGALIGLLCVGLLRQLLGIENASNIDRDGD